MHSILRLLLLTILFLSAVASESQSFRITGQLSDTSSQKKTNNAAILLLSEKDSVLIAFTRSEPNGQFTLKVKDTGRYVLLVTHPAFADYTDAIYMDKPVLDLRQVYMIPKEVALQTFVFKSYKGAVRMKGDTIEYVADSFKVKQNATIEDLLKKLPGMQVSKDGTITAQGKKVDKVLVDGEEFFSEDPTMVTRNLAANSLDKVQVYDKKSDQAELTGIDDGERTRTLNLKLKENSKRGYFGNIKGAWGPKNWYENQAMINLFRGRKKASAYIIHSNTNKKNLNWDEQKDFGTTDERSGTVYGDDGSVSYYSYNDDNGIDGGQGLPTNLNGGLHYSDTWKADSHHVVMNYTFGNIQRKGNGSTITQQLLSNKSYTNKQTNELATNGLKNSINVLYEFKPDSFNYFKIYSSFVHSSNKKITSDSSFYKDNNDSAINSRSRQNTSIDDNTNLSGKLEYRRKFRKRGRLVSVLGEWEQKQTNSNGTLLSLNSYYKENLVYKTDVINQLREVSNNNSKYQVTANYSEPITKKIIFQVSYNYMNNASRNTTNSYDNNPALGKILNPLYSNDYEFNTQSHTPGVNLNYVSKKLTLRAGTSIVVNSFYQRNVIRDSAFTYNFNNFQRTASFNYKFNPQKTLNVSYSGNIRQPSISQIQPIRNNTDPFNVYIGNPQLRSSLTNQLNMWFSDYKVLKSRYFYLSSYTSFTNRAFTSRDSIDSYGKRISQTVNINGNYNTSWWAYYSYKLSKRWGSSLNSDIQNSAYNNFVNGHANKTTSFQIGTGPNIDYEKDDTFDMSFGCNFEYNYSHSTVSSSGNTGYWIQTYHIDLTCYLPWKIEFNTDCRFTLRQKTAVFSTNNNMVIWNASIERPVFKDGKSVFSISINDILNQNIGFNRNISSNYITEQRYQTIRRYFLVSFKYSFSKQGAKNADKK